MSYVFSKTFAALPIPPTTDERMLDCWIVPSAKRSEGYVYATLGCRGVWSARPTKDLAHPCVDNDLRLCLFVEPAHWFVTSTRRSRDRNGDAHIYTVHPFFFFSRCRHILSTHNVQPWRIHSTVPLGDL